MTYSHAATPLKGVDAETDRIVKFNGDTIGRITRIPHEPREGQWKYSGLYYTRHPLNGYAYCMGDALGAIKKAHIDEGQPKSLRAILDARRSM